MERRDTTVFLTTSKDRRSITILIVIMLISLWPWFVYFYFSQELRFFLGVVLSLLAYFLSPRLYHFTYRVLGVFLVFLLAALLGTSGNFNAYFGTIMRCVPFFVYMCACQEVHLKTLGLFNKMFYSIITISLFFWILYLFGIPLLHGQLTAGNESYAFDNYYFFVKATYVESVFPRFSSIFIEPGYVGCFIVLMLFLDDFNFRKWYNVVYLVALILTFSLAGWFFFLIALIPYISRQGRKKWIYWVLLILVVGTYLYLETSNSVVNSMITSRLRFEDGRMAGYNRANTQLEDYWENGFWNSGKIWFGLRSDYYDFFDFGASVDSRAYIIRFGLLAFLAYVWFLLRCFIQNRSRFGLWLLIIVALFAFRGYSIMFVDALLFVYVAGLEKMKLKM